MLCEKQPSLFDIGPIETTSHPKRRHISIWNGILRTGGQNSFGTSWGLFKTAWASSASDTHWMEVCLSSYKALCPLLSGLLDWPAWARLLLH